MLQLNARDGVRAADRGHARRARSCTPRPSACVEAAELDRADPAAHPAAGRRGLHPRPLVLGGRDDLPDPAGHGRDLGPGARRAGRPRDRRRGRRDRHPLDLLAGAVHHPRPALGPGQRDVRRGPVPDRRAGLGDGPRLPGRRARPTRPRSSPRAKHFAGYSETQGGRDASEADISRRKLRSWFLPPFERVAREGCRTFMLGYQSMDGVPITVNDWLLNDVLRGEWGYTGTLVTDWDNVGRMVWEQQHRRRLHRGVGRAPSRAGNDMVMTTPKFFEGAQDAVAAGPARRGRHRRRRRADPDAEVRARPVREPAPARRRRARPRSSAPPSTPSSTSRSPAARWCCSPTTARCRSTAASRPTTPDGRRRRPAYGRRRRPQRRRPAHPARRLGRRVRPGRLAARRPPART